ncbi:MULTISPECIES: hypothetical protein [unclassified Gilliamella]|uniref:hypothetical protein n=1 Tax=unclassified Gilliamella TaxID=2685620 RepID=UPI001329A921|nr:MULTISPECIES: hypothetical protein [unclassified Gilliamella]MWN31751.1 hypothetical protein [Gilliamella sp. Pra-s60]MWP28858.1 hypothetical protein [Gilliamella sp. Pra-s54]
MKNLTIKKVALGLFLAGYAASSAFAVAPVQTVNTIEGTKPVLNSRGANPIANTVTVDIFHANGTPYTAGDSIYVGDKVRVTYRLTDADGDSDNAAAAKVKDSFKVFTKASSGSTWSPVTVQATASYDTADTELGTIEFELTSDFIGKSKIGFVIQPRTEFGAPSEGDWVAIGDIFGGGTPGVGGNGSNPGNSGGPGGGGNSSGGNTGGGNTGNGTNPGPIVSQTSQLGIFLIDNTGVIQNNESYTKSGTTLVPKYGERYAAIVWEDTNSDKVLDAGENELAGFSFEWHVVGNGIAENGNITAETGTLNSDGNRSNGNTDDTIFLGSKNLARTKHNGMYSFTTHKAGIQGYQLQVKM